MGGRGEGEVIGYSYHAGIHFIMCHGPVDHISRIQVNELNAWIGRNYGGEITINAPNLFGGIAREGGIVGQVDFEPGRFDQIQNLYLLEAITNTQVYATNNKVPAYRGVAGLVLKQPNLGMNPYLKPWSMTLSRIHTAADGQPQWYDEKAEITAVFSFLTPNSIYIALDFSEYALRPIQDIGAWPNSQSRAYYAKEDVKSFFDVSLVNAMRASEDAMYLNIQVSISSKLHYINKEWLHVTSLNETILHDISYWIQLRYDEFNQYYLNGTDPGGCDPSRAYTLATTWFTKLDPQYTKRTMFFFTQGTLINADDAYENAKVILDRTNLEEYQVDVYAANLQNIGTALTELLDNTGGDGVPSITLENGDWHSTGQVRNYTIYSLTDHTLSMNPAHIIRECLTNNKWGMGYQDSDIDDVSFTYAADVLYNEKMGMSILWDAESTIEDFIKVVCRHIDATVFVGRQTGQFVIKLIRDDFDEAALITLDPDNISSISDFARPSFGELVNSVTVTYHNVENDSPATLSVQDIALTQEQGTVINVSVEYDGFTNYALASRVAQRDLHTLSTPLITCTLIVNRDAEDLNLGDAFKLVWPDYDLPSVVMRVTGMAYGDGVNNRIRINCVQDIFSLPTDAFIAAPPSQAPVNPSPRPVRQQVAFELPYLQLVWKYGQTQVDTLLNSNQEIGYVGAAAARPTNNEINAILYTSTLATPEFTAKSKLDFCASAVLNEAIDEMKTQFQISNLLDKERIALGAWLQIDQELMSLEISSSSSMTVKRAVLDTVPAKHALGATILFWGNNSAADGNEYTRGEQAKLRIATVTGTDELNIFNAVEMKVSLESRAICPYPPANVKANGLYYPIEVLGSVTLTWASRNRLQQTSTDLICFVDDSVTPEPGTTYRIEVYEADGTTEVHTKTDIVDLMYTIPKSVLSQVQPTCVVKMQSHNGTHYSREFIITLNINLALSNGPPGDKLNFVMSGFFVPTNGDALNFTMGGY